MAARPELTSIEVCAGAGGLALGLKIVFGDHVRTVCYIEREAYAAAALVARMEEKTMDSAPIWDDITTFAGKGWRGCVDILTAGFPCQPHSVAGKRAGTDDQRWIWPDIARTIREVDPAIVFLENVPGLLLASTDEQASVGHVLGSLATLGYDAEWGSFSAAETGAPHKRERIFIMAYSTGIGWRQTAERFRLAIRESLASCQELADASHLRGRSIEQGQPNGTAEPVAITGNGQFSEHEAGSERRNGLGPASAILENPGHDRETGRGERSDGANCGAASSLAPGSSGVLAYTQEQHGADQGRQTQDAGRFSHYPPAPNDAERWSEILATHPHLEPAVYRVANGLANRVDRLRLCGNGVVPVVAALAFVVLAARVGLLRDGRDD